MNIPYNIIESHCIQITAQINKGDSFPVRCINFLIKNGNDSETRSMWTTIAQKLVMHGLLTVNDQNQYEIKP